MENEVSRILVDAIRALPVTADMIQEETNEDPLLSDVIKYLKTTWPTEIVDELLKILYNRRESLCEKDGCLLFNDRVVIPLSLQTKVLRQLHVAHLGMVRMKSLARGYVYWPNIDKDITDFVQNCSRCANAARAPVKVELSSWFGLEFTSIMRVRFKISIIWLWWIHFLNGQKFSSCQVQHQTSQLQKFENSIHVLG